MSVNGIGDSHYPAWREAGRVQKNSSGIGFASRMANVVGTNASENGRKTNAAFGRDNYVGGDTVSIYDMCVYSRKDIFASQDLKLPIETERYKIEDASYMEGVPAYEIVDKLTGKTCYMREDHMAIQKDAKTGMEFLINMDFDQPLTSNVLMTDELKNILNDFSEKRNFDIKEIPLQGGLVVNQDPKTGLNYLTISGNEGKGVSVILTSEEDIETLNKLVDEFQKYSVSSQRSTAGLYALLEISGNLKRGDEGFTYLTPDGITYIPYDGNPSKAWEIVIPTSDYSAARKYLAMGIEASNYQTWLSKFNSAKLLDSDAELFNHFGNGRVLADKESEKADKQESKTKTDIIVKPDGSRVLVMTMSIGGMETTMSLEISKPTEAPNENSKQNTDNNMPTAENDMVSDEMTNISNGD